MDSSDFKIKSIETKPEVFPGAYNSVNLYSAFSRLFSSSEWTRLQYIKAINSINNIRTSHHYLPIVPAIKVLLCASTTFEQ
jgi:hypothetical protein